MPYFFLDIYSKSRTRWIWLVCWYSTLLSIFIQLFVLQEWMAAACSWQYPQRRKRGGVERHKSLFWSLRWFYGWRTALCGMYLRYPTWFIAAKTRLPHLCRPKSINLRTQSTVHVNNWCEKEDIFIQSSKFDLTRQAGHQTSAVELWRASASNPLSTLSETVLDSIAYLKVYTKLAQPRSAAAFLVSNSFHSTLWVAIYSLTFVTS